MIQLNYRDAKPIYEQIKDGIRRLVISSAIVADEKLPSVRELASHLAINPNTIQKAYHELEKEGYVYTIAGKGTFASPDMDNKDLRRQQLMEDFDDIVVELLYLSVKPASLEERVEELQREGIKA